jgi:flagellar motor switch protein FliN
MIERHMKDAARKWLADEWAEATARAIQSMSDVRPAITASAEAPLEDPERDAGGLCLEVTFSLSAETIIWVVLPAETLQDLGLRTLRAAGIEDADSDEIRNTCNELIQQSSSGLSQAISSRLKQRVSSQLRETKPRESGSVPAGKTAFRFDIAFPDAVACAAYVFVAPQLINELEEPTAVETTDLHEASAEVAEGAKASSNPANSKTFDLLLEVSMPVSVSFGRTEMLIREVLKLTTGSIVELNRSVTEPVDVIVNDCIIARGEVVVVDGNYGVRIHQIASRQDRLRSSGQPLASIGKPELIV